MEGIRIGIIALHAFDTLSGYDKFALAWAYDKLHPASMYDNIK